MHITEKAVQMIKEISNDQGIGHYIVRVKVIGGGCAGFSYDMIFDDVIGDMDEVVELDGVKVICDAVSFQYMEGTVVDYNDSLMGAGFCFKNSTQTGCGCGKSFSY
jgi:iron-sulfur cluster insertion protein